MAAAAYIPLSAAAAAAVAYIPLSAAAAAAVAHIPPDGYDPDHFMLWVHPFTSVISGLTGSGKSVFVRRFVHNIKHMMTPIPDRILWCYGEYQTLYETVDGVDFNKDCRTWTPSTPEKNI
jgi:hypothetical protein